MSNPGEWINFAELQRRAKAAGLNKCARTLRRYIKEGLISKRQAVRRGRCEFNWKTVERELRAMDSGLNPAAYVGCPPDLVREFEELRGLVRSIALRVGVPESEMFAGEQSRRAG